jgi:hypothetical protein
MDNPSNLQGYLSALSRAGVGGALPDRLRGPGLMGDPRRLDDEIHDSQGTQRDAWSRLVKGQPLGKMVNLEYDNASATGVVGPQPFFEVGGSDYDACQLQVTFDLPRVIPAPFISAPLDISNAQGSQNNLEVGAGDFPGTAAPISWVPIAILIEWGVNSRTFAVVDFKNGAAARIVASWVRAFPIVTTDAAENAPGTSAIYSLRANLGPGWPHERAAQRTIYVGELAAEGPGATSAVFATPPHAIAATIASNVAPPGATEGYIVFCQSPDGTNPLASYLVDDQPGRFDIPNGGAYWFIVNASGAAKYQAIFDLAI